LFRYAESVMVTAIGAYGVMTYEAYGDLPERKRSPIPEGPLCARCISESRITLSDPAAYARNTAGAFTLNDDRYRCPRCGRAAKVFSLVRRKS